MAGLVLQPSGQVPSGSHIPASISKMHINVVLCPPHILAAWDVWFAIWHWFTPLQLLYMTPKWPSQTGCLYVLPNLQLMLLSWGVVGLEVARHVCHQQKPMAAKEANHLMATSLKLPAAQELELNSNLRVEAFFQDFEKQRAFQSQFEYKRKLLGLLKGIRMSMTPLFQLTDELESFEAKLKLFCGELGIILAELDGDTHLQKGIGLDSHPIILNPIVAGPRY